jgi:hypothetical protein
MGKVGMCSEIKSTSDMQFLVYDGLSETLYSSQQQYLPLSQLIPESAKGRKVLVVMFKNGYKPKYMMVQDTEKQSPLHISKLHRFEKKVCGYAYLSGAIVRASVGGKRKFHTGIITPLKGQKVYIEKLSSSEKIQKKFELTTDENGQFGIYVAPGTYRVIYGTKKVFHLERGENGIFLMSLKNRFD